MPSFSIDRSSPEPMPAGAVVRRMLAAFVATAAIAAGGLLAYASAGPGNAVAGSQSPASNLPDSSTAGASHDASVPRASAVFDDRQLPAAEEPVPTF